MKRALTSIFGLTLIFVTASVYAPLAHAQTSVPIPAATLTAPTTITPTALTPTTLTATDLNVKAPDPLVQNADGTYSSVPPGSNNPTTLGSGTADDTSYDGIMSHIMGLFAWLLGVAALTLDNAMYYTVVQMGSYVHGLAAIGTAWRILRDLGNIVLIFGFLAIGITTILDVGWYGGGTKMLPMLLVAAVFLNFSLFISEAVIDAGNLFATEFYTQINGGQVAQPVTYSAANVHNEGISNKIMAQLGLQTIYNFNFAQNKIAFDSGNMWFVGFFAVILFLIAAFVMFSLAFILIARFVALIFLIVVAPIGFAGLAIPQLKGTANQWWGTLFEQAITAPVLLLLLYVALAVITDASFLTGFGVAGSGSAASNTAANAWIQWLNGGQGVDALGSMILSFLVAMGLLLAVTIVAKRMSAFGASGAMKLGGALTFGATAYGLSLPVNAASRAGKTALQRYAPNNRFTRTLSQGLSFGEKARMDIRSIPGVGAGLKIGGAGEAATPIKTSAIGRIDQAREVLRKSSEATSKEVEQAQRIPQLRAAIGAENTAEVTRRLGNLSDKELESGEVMGVLTNPENASVVAALPQNRFDKLLTSDAISDHDKTTLRTQRSTGVRARYANTLNTNPRFVGRTVAYVTLNGALAGPGGVPPRVPGMSSTQRAEIDSDILTQPHIMALLTPSDFVAVARRAQLDAAAQATMAAYVRGISRTATDPRARQIRALLTGNPNFSTYFP